MSLRKVPGSRTQDRTALKDHGSISDNPRHSHYPYITGEKLGISGVFSKQWNKKEVTVELSQVPLNETLFLIGSASAKLAGFLANLKL